MEYFNTNLSVVASISTRSRSIIKTVIH